MLVRGPRPAYVELISAGRDESNPWLDRVRSTSGPISWAIAVDDVDVARDALVEAGFEPQPVVEGSRRTPEGDVVGWRMCDVGPAPYDGALPFLIQWTTPMAPGPADGPVLEWVSMTPPDPDRLAQLLVAVGFVPSRHWPRRVFHEVEGGLGLTLSPVGETEDARQGSWSMSWEAEADEPRASVSLGVPSSEATRHTLDGVGVSTRPDRRRFPAASLLPDVDKGFARLRGGLADWPDPHPGGASPPHHEYSRVTDPGRYRLLGVRADSWVQVLVERGLGRVERPDPGLLRWQGEHHLAPSRVAVVRGPVGTQPVVVAWSPPRDAGDAFVQIGVGEPVEVLDRQPDCGCDACDTGSADLLETIDSALILALNGGVYTVRDGTKVVTRSLDGWSSSGTFAPGESERWLAEAADGRRTDGVVAGTSWL